jgi:hypothetical protein
MLSSGQNITAHAIVGYFDSDGSYGGDILEIPSNVPATTGRYVLGTADFTAASGITPEFTFTPVTLPSAGMVCFGGGGGVFPQDPPAWSRTTMSNWVDCVPYGGYTGPPIAMGPATPFGPGDGSQSLTRISDTDNTSVDFALACPGPTNVRNAVGFNHDNHIDLPSAFAFDDLTWPNSDLVGDGCGDTDDDNDGLLDTDETSLPGTACPAATAATNTLAADTDGDRFLDGAECTLGTNPNDALSKPLLADCGAAGDADGDRILTRIEICHYNSNPNVVDTDGDAATVGGKDGCEVVSINADRIVSSGDQGVLATRIGAGAGSPNYVADFDLNKDGATSSGDQGIMASFIVPGGQCP